MAAPGPSGNCLHLVLSASGEALARCLRVALPGDSLLFADDGVRHLSAPVELPAALDAAWSGPCAAARGLEPVARARGAALVADSEFAGLLDRHRHCLSWT